jgi:hypothetical protein
VPWWGWLLVIWLGSAVVLVTPLIIVTVAQRTSDLLRHKRDSRPSSRPSALRH